MRTVDASELRVVSRFRRVSFAVSREMLPSKVVTERPRLFEDFLCMKLYRPFPAHDGIPGDVGSACSRRAFIVVLTWTAGRGEDGDVRPSFMKKMLRVCFEQAGISLAQRFLSPRRLPRAVPFVAASYFVSGRALSRNERVSAAQLILAIYTASSEATPP